MSADPGVRAADALGAVSSEETRLEMQRGLFDRAVRRRNFKAMVTQARNRASLMRACAAKLDAAAEALEGLA